MNSEPVPRCPNCQAAIAERFCPSCGQEYGELFPSAVRWLSQVVSDTLNVDGKLPSTVRALVWPLGKLTLEWHQGRRARYMAPLRLYLMSALVFFFTWPLTAWPQGLTDFARGVVAERVGPDPSVGLIEPEVQLVRDALPGLFMVVLVPVLGILLHVVVGRTLPLVSSLVVALHMHALVFLLTPLTLPFAALPTRYADTALLGALVVVGLSYLVTALVRVHRFRWWSALLRAFVAVGAYFLAGLLVVGVVTMLLLGA